MIMKKDLLTMTTVALTTATLTVTAFWAAPLEAGGEADSLTPKIARPKLVAKGVEVTLAPLSGIAQPGDEPVFELAAVNTSTQPAETKVRLLMTSMSPADALSRVIRVPGKLWEGEQSIVLAPKEQKTFRVATGTKLPAKNMISVTLSESIITGSAKEAPHQAERPRLLNAAEPGIAVLQFSTSGSAPELASANTPELTSLSQ